MITKWIIDFCYQSIFILICVYLYGCTLAKCSMYGCTLCICISVPWQSVLCTGVPCVSVRVYLGKVFYVWVYLVYLYKCTLAQCSMFFYLFALLSLVSNLII